MNIDAASALTAASWFASLVGLLCNWKQERTGSAPPDLSEFVDWLRDHRFDQLLERISASDELKLSLASLLREDLGTITGKLDAISETIASISLRITGLAEIQRAIAGGFLQECLSEQACLILKILADNDGKLITVVRTLSAGRKYTLSIRPRGPTFEVSEHRFVPDDLKALCNLGFISQDRPHSLGESYNLTRLGASFAAQLEPAKLNPPEVESTPAGPADAQGESDNDPAPAAEAHE